MSATTFRAIVRDDYVEWIGGAPDTRHGLAVTVTVDDKKEDDSATRWQRAVDALAEIAARGTFVVPDPVAWQREIRKDRPLPGRE